MNSTQPQNGLVIIVSFLVAYLLTMLPLPDAVGFFRPYWVAMVLIYWCMALPHRVGVGIGWISGLILDGVYNTLLGQHALGLALLAYCTVSLHQRVRVFPLWQQSLTVLVLCWLYAALVLWVKGMTGHPPDSVLWFLLPTFTTALSWPVIFVVMRRIRRGFHVT
ncbi:MAG: rod shape-determining protein MreD [Gammaproteobacteria bacterium]|nr:rod shape-determining protein MreD [Gammaproteobacteria bacterium]